MVHSERMSRFSFRLAVRVFRMLEACLNIMEPVICFCFAIATHPIEMCVGRRRKEPKEDLEYVYR